MSYITIAEFAAIKKISTQAVNKNCRNGKYEGAYQDDSGRWHIPRLALQTENKQVRRKVKKEIRTNRPLKATDSEWRQIVENATAAQTSTNNYVVHAAIKNICK